MSSISESHVRPHMFVLCSHFPALSETFVLDHIAGMLGAGWRVTIVARRINDAETEQVCALLGASLDFIQLPDWAAATAAQRLVTVWRALRLIMRKIPSHVLNRAAWTCAIPAVPLSVAIGERGPRVVHAHFGQNGVTAALASDRALLVNFHGHDFTSWTKRRGWKLYRDAFRDATIIAHSDFAEKRLVKFGLDNIRRVTMGVDLGRFVFAHRAESWPRPLRLLSVGRLVPQKGHDVVVRALALLRKLHPELDIRLQIVGAGSEQDRLRRITAELGMCLYVEGPAAMASSGMPLVYNSADILIVASQSTSDGWEEAFCRVAVEGMACGLPVIATPCGGLPDTVGEGGIIAVRQDARALAAALGELLRGEGPSYWAQRARDSAKRFGIDQMRQEYRQWTELCSNSAS